MPELPDLQVFRKNLEKKFKGKKLVELIISNDKKINVPADKLKKSLEGKTLDEITRDGKELHFHFQDQVLGIHLMLNGEFNLFDGDSASIKNKIIELIFEDKSGLALTDWQAYANANLNPKKSEAPDAFSKDFDLEYLTNGMKRFKSKRVKDLIMDQKFVRGIGNAYADEILWDSKIHPLSKSGKIPDDKIKQFYKSIIKVLKDAEEQILKSNPNLIKGEIRDFLKVHNSKISQTESGGKIIYEKIGGRGTYYTKEQILYE